MSDLKIDARLKEINIKIRAMEGEQTRRRLEAANGLNDELHAIDDKFHEEMKALKENYMQERQSIEDRYFADRKAIDKEYEDKRLDLIDSIKEVIGDISEVVGFETNKPQEPITTFDSVDNNYTSIFDNKENTIDNDVIDTSPVIQTPLTSLDEIEESLEEVTNGFSPIEPAIEEVNVPEVDNLTVNVDIPENTNISVEEPIIQEPIMQESVVPEQVINQNLEGQPVLNEIVPEEPIIVNENVQEPVTTQVPVQELETVPVEPIIEQQVITQAPVINSPEPIQQAVNVVQTPPMINEPNIQEGIPAPVQTDIVQDINASIDNVLGDINPNAN